MSVLVRPAAMRASTSRSCDVNHVVVLVLDVVAVHDVGAAEPVPSHGDLDDLVTREQDRVLAARPRTVGGVGGSC